MLATIDTDTERKLERDRRDHGVAYMRVLPCGRIEHVPVEAVALDRIIVDLADGGSVRRMFE